MKNIRNSDATGPPCDSSSEYMERDSVSQLESSIGKPVDSKDAKLGWIAAMARPHAVACVLGIIVAVVAQAVSALYLCPSATTTLGAMEPCMASVEGANPDPPDDDCCYVIRTTEPGCLCVAFSGYKNSRSINFKAALTLPHLCGRAVPVNFTCNGVPVPSAGLPPSRKLML